MKHEDSGPVVFAVPGDLHLTEQGLDNHQIALAAVDENNELVKPDFVQFIGDNVQHATEDQFRLFSALTARVRAPWSALVGDHDVHDDREASGFRRWVGDTYGSRTVRGFRFLRLNSQEGDPLGMSDEQLTWLEAEMAAAGRQGQRVVVFQHNYPYQIWEAFAGRGINRWRVLVHTWPVTAIVCGHTHYAQIANDGHNVFVAVRSIGDPEGGSAGYAIGYVDGEDLAITYRCVADPGPIILITHPRESLLSIDSRHVVSASDEFRARLWSRHEIVTVRARIDDREWVDGHRSGELDWAGELDTMSLAKGEHRLTVEITDKLGAKASRSILFPFDRTGRYTAVPIVRPAVDSTNFC